ncbi:Endonuclease/exonuclease/phosphatase, partial [Sparassis latifolia]
MASQNPPHNSGFVPLEAGSEQGPEYNSRTPATPRPSLPRHVQRRFDTARFVIFNTGETTVPQAWRLLQGCLDKGFLDSIVSIARVTHASKRPRLDLFVRRELGDALKRNIREVYRDVTPVMRVVLKRHLSYWDRRLKFPWDWRIDVYKPWRDRQSLPTPITQEAREEYTSIMTWNVNGFHSKIIEIEDALRTERVAVCAIQETLVNSGAKPLIIQGYNSYTVPWEEGFRGQAVLIDNRLPSYRVPHEEPWLLHVKISHWRHASGANKVLHIMGVYFPSGGNYRGSRRKKVQRLVQITNEIFEEKPTDIVVVLGDYNMAFDKLSRYLNNCDNIITGIHTRGSNFSRFPVRGGPSDLDHIVGSPDVYTFFRRPRVLR